MNCEVSRVFESIWFPESLTLNYTRDGEAQPAERMTIKVINVNQPIPQAIFSLATGNVPPGQLVSGNDPMRGAIHHPPRFAMIWDGKTIREMTREDEAARWASRTTR
jgi:hypothetical protein